MTQETAAAEPKEKSNDPEWVQIDRKWYRKTPDNIYLVNGKRVLFIENRNRATQPTTKQ